jgi:glycosyltransferase involved in cell wall biosynthesis
MKLVVQIPCYNEAATLPAVLADLPKSVPGIDSIEVLVIDDGSSDGTAEVARAHGATRVVRHRGNRGLASTFLTGLETALEMDADVIVNTDGDHQYPGTSIAALVAPILAGEADLVIGDRQTQIDPKVPTKKRMFYDLGNFVVRTATGMSVHDAPSGFRAMSREFAMRVYLTNPFSYTLETIFAAAEAGQPIREVPITTNAATRPSRLFRGFLQYIGRSASIILQGYSMHNPLRAFGWLSLPFLLLGTGLGLRFLYYFVLAPDDTGHVQSLILASISIVVGAQIFIFGMLGSLVRANRLLLQDVRMRVRRLELHAGIGRDGRSSQRPLPADKAPRSARPAE